MDDARLVCAHCGFEVTQQDRTCPLCEETVNAVSSP